MGALGITPLDEQIEKRDECDPAWKVEIRDLARGFAGALFVSLPLLYTMEMWQHGRELSGWTVIGFLVAGYFVNVGFCAYAGFRQTQWTSGYFWDAMTALGIGAVASVLTLTVAGIIDFSLSPEIMWKIVALESVPCGIGAAVARNQLGGGDSSRSDDSSPFSSDMSVFMGSLLGGVLFAYNIAPTMETVVITTKQDWWLALATVILSLAVTFVIVEIAKFVERDYTNRTIFTTPFIETVFSYAVALVVSFAFLFGFDYISWGDDPAIWVPRVVTAAYATALGGAAGRLVL
ncbi:DUF2391 family protein [Qipengyuania nanhaisediminis]|uniref:DUF2391 family protein n=1 Tax=Qipengyuania nanhaisediminis TaxID=604088 RepID=UPI0038B318E7